MSHRKKNNASGSAFPSQQGETNEGTWNQTFDSGMSKREWFAGLAMQGLIATGRYSLPLDDLKIRDMAYQQADAMLSED